MHSDLHNPRISSNPASLKRTRSVGSYHRKFNASLVPPLPRINSDLILQVFTHKSLRRPNVSPAEYGDNERLAILGKSVFEATLSHCLFRNRPFLKGAEILKRLEILLSSSMIDDWVNFYKLRAKLLCHPTVFPSLQLLEETHSLFHAYVGGLFLSSGPQAVNNWVIGLIEQELEVLPRRPESESDARAKVELPAYKRVRSEAASESPTPSMAVPPIFFASQPPPSPPLQPAVHLPIPGGLPPKPTRAALPKAAALPPNPMAPAQPNLPFLPLFKQAAAQRRVTVEYLAEFIGPSHAGRWVVKCIVNGMFKGEGTGGSKQIAKENAARKAYYSMGWT